MVTFFRRILIYLGKVIPFALAFILLVGYTETIYALLANDTIVEAEENVILNLPLSFCISDFIYIDLFDVIFVWILCVALELCKYSFRCAYIITLNLPFRWLVEHVSVEAGVIVAFASLMSIYGFYCIYGGIKILFK